MLARLDRLDSLKDVRQEHLQLLTTMHQVGMKWIERFLAEDESLCFRLGFHSVCRTFLLASPLCLHMFHYVLDN